MTQTESRLFLRVLGLDHEGGPPLIKNKTLRQVPREAWDAEHLDPKTRLEVLAPQWDPEVS